MENCTCTNKELVASCVHPYCPEHGYDEASDRARRVGEAVLRSLSDSYIVAAIEAEHLDPGIRSLEAAGYYSAAEAYRAIQAALRGEP